MTRETAVGVRLRTLTPYHYRSTPVPGGMSTIPQYLGDLAIMYAVAKALGSLAPSVALPCRADLRGGVLRDLRRMPWLASVLESRDARLMPRLGRRLSLDGEGGLQETVEAATSTGNVKTWYFIQEVPPGTVYEGAIFGAPDVFEAAGEAQGAPAGRIVVRIGRNLSGVASVERCEAIEKVRLNLWTDQLVGMKPDLEMERYALHNIQPSESMEIGEAAARMRMWREHLSHRGQERG